MNYTVTQEHIDNGVACSPTHCPVANALHNPGQTVKVGYYGIDVEVGNIKKLYRVSHDLRQKIVDFDNGRKVLPFDFTLDEPFSIEIHLSA